jgi:hypothetical protein
MAVRAGAMTEREAIERANCCERITPDWSWLGVEPADDGLGLDRWKIRLDWAEDEEPDFPMAVNFTADFMLRSFAVVAQRGPVGIPVIEFIGTWEHIMNALAAYHDDERISKLTIPQVESH